LLHLHRDDVPWLERRHRVLLLPVDHLRVLIICNRAGLPILSADLQKLLPWLNLLDLRDQLTLLWPAGPATDAAAEHVPNGPQPPATSCGHEERRDQSACTRECDLHERPPCLCIKSPSPPG